MEIDQGNLYDGAGNFVDIGSELHYGSNNLIFNSAEIGKTRTLITVNNSKESEHTTNTIELKIHPIHFAAKTAVR